MLHISMPFSTNKTSDGFNLIIKPLRIDITEPTLRQAHETARSLIQELVEEDWITVENSTFQEDPKRSGNGLFVCIAYQELVDKILEYSPLPEEKDEKSDRKKRIEAQEHLNRLK